MKAKEIDDLAGEPTEEFIKCRNEVWSEWRAKTLADVRSQIIHDFQTLQ